MGHIRPLIVFDLDGTLIDSRRDLAAAANALIVERGGEALSEGAIGSMVGDGAAMLVRRALTAVALPVTDDSVVRFLELYDERLLDTTKVYAGIPAVLRELAPAYEIALLTNKPIAPTRKLLDALDLTPFVSASLGGDGPHPRKPDPTGLRQLMAQFDRGPDATVMVGDSDVDLKTARAAGAAACLVSYGYGGPGLGQVQPKAREAVVSAPAGLPAVIARLLEPQPSI